MKWLGPATVVFGVFGLVVMGIMSERKAEKWREVALDSLETAEKATQALHVCVGERSVVAVRQYPQRTCACAAQNDGLCVVDVIGDRVRVRTFDGKPPKVVRCFEERDGGMVRADPDVFDWWSER